MRTAVLAIAVLLAAGCEAWKWPGDPAANPPAPTTQPSAEKPAPSTQPYMVPSPTPLVAQARPRQAKPADPPVVTRPVVSLTVYHLSVPFGSVSGSEAFWKRVDEQAMDIAVHEVLYKNGLRVGRAAFADFEQFLQMLQTGPVQAKPSSYISANVKTVELTMKRGVAQQIIYDFDARNTMTVRSYDDSDNLLVVEFQPIPRRAGDVRVSLCPMVRALRKRLTAIGDVETREISYRSPERYFEMNLRTDLPLDKFLVLAPSPEARSSMSLGHNFLVHDSGAGRMEDVLLILPQPLQPRAPRAAEAAPREAEKKSAPDRR